MKRANLFWLMFVLVQTQRLLAADFTITEQFAGPPWVGFGAQFNPWAYCKPNWGEVNENNLKNYEQKVIDLAPQHVRIFVEVDRDSPRRNDPVIHASVLRTIELAQRAGATVNLTLWHGPYPDVPDATGRMADFVDEALGRGLTAVQYITLQNEPNLHNFNKKLYLRLYRQFDLDLRRRGLRDRIKIVGGDLVSIEQEAWFGMLADDLWDVLDGYSVHMYSDYWDGDHLLDRVSGIMPIVAAMPRRAQRPVYITEFGTRGHRSGKEEPGKLEDGTPLCETTVASVCNAWVMMEAMNRGFVAAVQWDLVDLRYNRSRMYYGLIGEPAKGFPLRPGYHLMHLFTHTTKPGWRAMKIDGARSDALVSATKGPAGELTVYAQNRAREPQALAIAGAPPNADFARQIWNENGDGRRSSADPVSSDARGVLSLTVAPMSIVALTRN
jgi:hypothetical protein